MNHHTNRRRGFTLIELIIVILLLGILGAVIIPKYFGAGSSSREMSLRTQLQRVRTQLEYYRAKVGDSPDIVNDQWAPLLDNEYLVNSPTNPLNGSEVVASAPGAGVGWVWRDKGNGTYALFATDETHLAEWNEG